MPSPIDFPSLPACLCLAGPTAAGKTATALAMADALRPWCEVEIVSVDSALVYRGMDIGTAKPSAAERAGVPHHLIDILEPCEAYSAARFVSDAQGLVRAIHARGRLPLLVGGTMLYFKALFDGLDPMPAADAEVRAALALQAEHEGLGALYAELVRVDPVTAQRLAPNDTQRIQRALEVHRISGQPLSAFHRDKSAASPAAPPPLLSLEPRERAWLHQRIGERMAQMMDAGLVDEVRLLRQRDDLHAGLPSMRCVGYRQTWEALDSGDLSGLAERCSAATRQLAKRQLTWLRSLPQRQVVACDDPTAVAQAVAWAQQHAATALAA
ncbi:MAG: tRNA (adenosine(37)-N6)-dimethylallyltransferase MiaA [Pseudomonadota bacterium]